MSDCRALNTKDSRLRLHSFSSVVSRSECEKFKRRLQDFHGRISTFPGHGTSVLAVGDRLQSFSDTLDNRMQNEGKQLILAADAGITAEGSLILRNASARFEDCFTDATSCIVLVEREIGNCQEQIGVARNDVQKLTRQVEEARREADRLRDECRVLEARIRDIDSEIERLAENARRHRREAKKSENAAIAWGVGGLLLAPFTFGASVVVAAPATVVNVVNMGEERSRASDCEESKRDYERSLRDKETQKSNWNARIRDLSADCTKKENHIGIG